MQADLVQYHDHNRLLVLFAPSALDPRLVREQDAFRNEAKAMKERQLLQFVVLKDSTFPKGPDAERLRKKYGVVPNAFEAILIGKDGTVAYRSKSLVTPHALYARIDAMPMRKDEIRRQRKG